MQVVSPIDIEDALRIDLNAINDAVYNDARFFAPPIPPDLKAGDVLIERVGGARVCPASHEYDVSVDCYAENDADAVEMANYVQGLLTSLPLRDTSQQYSNATAGIPYANFDPRAPQLARQTFRATVTCPGTRINF